MVGRRGFASWLSGPGVASDAPAPDRASYPGERLGRPPSGPGSMAPPGRRLAAIAIDWLVVSLIATVLLEPLGRSAGPLLVLLVEQTLLVGTAGYSLGHRVAGLRVEALEGGPAGIGRAALRSVLLCLALPPLIWDRDQRGLHDRAARTVAVRR